MSYRSHKGASTSSIFHTHHRAIRQRTRTQATRRHRKCLGLERLEPRMMLDGALVITELLAGNGNSLVDAEGDHSDWLEIHNRGDAPVLLDGWHLTDDRANLGQFEFPSGSGELGEDEYIVVFASGKDGILVNAGSDNRLGTNDDYEEIHADFKLSLGGEYLALVEPDGVSISHEFAPEFPRQYADVSFGAMRGPIEILPDGTRLTYHVPTIDNAAWGANWADVGFDDSSWGGAAEPSPVLITEIGTRSPDWAEVQNVSDTIADTTGWVVAANNASGAEGINAVHDALWPLPSLIAPGEVLYRSDNSDDEEHYWNENISWGSTGSGWLIVLDDGGNVADFVVWGYNTAELATFDVTINGSRVTTGHTWQGAPIVMPSRMDRNMTIQRRGSSDHGDASDWAFVDPLTQGEANAALNWPFPSSSAADSGLGFAPAGSDLFSEIGIDVGSGMHGVNASIWTRIPFAVDDPVMLESLQLQLRYNDGVAVYLNGQEVARRNAPETVSWNSTATVARSVADTLQAETIDLGASLDLLHAGTNILALQGLNTSADDTTFLLQADLTADMMRYFAQPTPGEPNSGGAIDFVRDTKFSVDRGFFDEPFTVAITTETEGATIRYTTDGSEPDDTNGSTYVGPITIDGTTTLRAIACRPGFEPSNIDTQTYVFLDQVIRQDGAGWPNNWGHAGADYAMDPEVVNSPLYRDTIIDDMKSIPSVSLVMDRDSWFGSGGHGIYPRGEGVERAVSMELIYPDGTKGFQINSAVQIVGGSSVNRWKSDKLSMRVKFKDPYGPAKLDFPVFEKGPLGDGATDRFDTLVLDARLNQAWHYGGGASPSYQRSHAQYIRDQYVADIQNAMGNNAPHGISVHLYLNGLYWGVYRMHERPDSTFGASYFGGDQEDYYAMKHRTSTVVDGGTDARTDYAAMFSVANAGLASAAQYAAIQEYLDVPNFINYMISNFYAGNTDWAHQNWYATRDFVDPDGRWRYHSWDAEHVMKNTTDNVTSKNQDGGPTRLHQQLKANAEYKILFADHLYRHFFNEGTLTPENAAALYDIRADEVREAVVGASARWGDNRRSTPYTRDVEWVSEYNRLMDDYFPRRTGIVLGQLRSQGLYPDIAPPTFNQRGGDVEPSFEVSLSAPTGAVYYTLDGSDPRLPGGSVSPSAERFDGPIDLAFSTKIRTRTLHNGTWSALDEAQFFIGTPASAENLVITEINYYPQEPAPVELAIDATWTADDFEFVELWNKGNEPIDLSAVTFVEGIDFTFESTVGALSPGQYVVVVADEAAFTTRYGADGHGKPILIAGSFDRTLDNAGERVMLHDRFGQSIVGFRFNDTGAWPGRADGKGATLELIDPTFTPAANHPDYTTLDEYLNASKNWRGSSEYGGSPGSEGSGPITDVVVNEVLSRTADPMLDAIELFNTTDRDIDVGGWYLSDSWGWDWSEANGDYKKFRIPDATVLAAGGHLVFDESHFNASGGLNPASHPKDFALDGLEGDDVWLMKADATGTLTHFVEHVEFPATPIGESLGRYPNGHGDLVPMTERTLGGENAEPRVGPIIISEVMYHPPNAGEMLDENDLEFIEIHNPTATVHLLDRWRIQGGVEFDFPEGARIESGETLVVLSFDPNKSANVDKLTAFHDFYGIDTADGATYFGGYSGRLENNGETVRLLRAGEPSPLNPGLTPYYWEDSVSYDDASPWPMLADGLGHSLHRRDAGAFGSDATSWQSAFATPGTVPFASKTATVVDRLVFYNDSAFDGRNGGLNAADDGAIATDKEALLPGETAALANYTSFSSGLNGLMIDIAGLADPAALNVAGDFSFKIGNDEMASSWHMAPLPVAMNVRLASGMDGSDRVTFAWDDQVIANTWLQVTVRATESTGLAQDDVFYFGNAVGETGNSTSDARVTTADELLARTFQHGLANTAAIDDLYDFNRDRLVNVADRIIARNARTSLEDSLRLFTAPAVDAAMMSLDDAYRPLVNSGLARAEWIAEFDLTDEELVPSKRAGRHEMAVDTLLRTFFS